ncbi:sterol desaturase family protein [Aliikangiella marina]|uniref:Sterol desaturase family protein n=1 Tax=Aliikangiella marina TaxID=1712262 RepID=A0A545T8Z4_9GAMM|nr:sterol desaturase family protein [Aliikangiella marina]TQV73697.1 sterol desaturase family protein [Aliikangiella marina]
MTAVETLSAYYVPMLVTLILIEMLVRLFVNRSQFNFSDAFANIFVGVIGRVLQKVAWIPITYWGFSFFHRFAPMSIDMSYWWAWPLIILLADHFGYWQHRSFHMVRILWATHSTHHTSEHFNFSTSVRQSVIELAYRWLWSAPLTVIGFDPVSCILAMALIRYYQFWIHTDYIGKIPLVDGIFNTASNHRVHHAINPQYIDKNFGFMFIIWDKLYGTYAREAEKPVYGTTKLINSKEPISYNPITINFREFKDIYRDIKAEPSWKNKLFYLVKEPGWEPKNQEAVKSR